MIEHVLGVVAVNDFDMSHDWYQRFFDRPPTNTPMPGQLAEWKLTNNGWLQIHRDPDRAGRSLFNLAVDDLDTHVRSLAARQLEPTGTTEANKGVRIASFTDPDHNIISLIANFREKY